MQEYQLKYGCNPNQRPSRLLMKHGSLPIELLNGTPGYINFLDALNGWQLVKELKEATGLPSAASFKHVSPAGVSVGIPLTDTLKKAYFAEGTEYSPIACAYIRARGTDRVSSFGDFVSLSDECDETTARYLSKEVSDGIIAPLFSPDALEILKKKKNGKYIIIKIDADYVPDFLEQKDVFGITFEQARNDIKITDAIFENIVTKNKCIPQGAKLDMLIAMLALKYTQSNSVCYALGGQTTGVGAGQQSRILCTKLAGNKSDSWFFRQHEKVISLQFKDIVKRSDRDNAIDLYISDHNALLSGNAWEALFTERPCMFSADEKADWLKNMKNVSLASDAFFTFGDNIERAFQSGVKYISETGGSINDNQVIEICNKYNMTMAFSGIRLFHH